MSKVGVPLSLEQLLEKARIHFCDKQYAECKACADEILDKYGDDVPAEAEALTLKGACCFFEGEYDEAECVLRRAIELDGSNPLSFQYLGQTLENKNEETDAICCYGLALALEPENVACCALLGRLYQRRKDAENAILYSGRSLEIMARNRNSYSDPDFATQQAEYGAALVLDNRVEEAEACFLSSIEIAPNSLSYFMLAMMYINGQLEKSRTYLEKLSDIAVTPDDHKKIKMVEVLFRLLEMARSGYKGPISGGGGGTPPPTLQ